MDNKEFILSLYRKGYTPKYIANLMYKKAKRKDSFVTFNNLLHFVEKTILEFYTN